MLLQMLFAAEFARLRNLTLAFSHPKKSRTHTAHLLDYPRLWSQLGLNSLFLDLRMRPPALRHPRHQLSSATLGMGGAQCHAEFHLKECCWCDLYGPRSPRNCWEARENAFLFQKYAPCLQCAFQAFGRARSMLLSTSGIAEVTVVWHVRIGDVMLHAPSDSFFSTVATQLAPMLKPFRTRFVIVGGGAQSKRRQLAEYIRALARIGARTLGPRFVGCEAGASDFVSSFHQMLHADGAFSRIPNPSD